GPFTAATTGSGKANKASTSGLKCASSAAPTSSGRPPPAARSAPLEKPRPAPVSSKARAPLPGRPATAASISSSIALVSALRLSGRFSVSVATAAGLCVRMMCWKAMRVRNAPGTESLARRADPPDGVADIVGDKQRPVPRDLHADRPTHRMIARVDEAGEDVDRQTLRAPAGEGHENHLIAAERPPVPRAMLADEDP